MDIVRSASSRACVNEAYTQLDQNKGRYFAARPRVIAKEGAAMSLPVVANGAVIMLVLGLTAVAPDPGRPVAVLTLPWSPTPRALDVVAGADGAVLAMPRPWLILAGGEGSDFVARLYRSGAVLVVDAGRAGLCRSKT